jgi:WD40 repeat protein
VITWKAHEKTVLGMAYSPDGTRLATFERGSDLVRVWDPAERAEVASFRVPNVEADPAADPEATCVAFSQCGKYLAVGGAVTLGSGLVGDGPIVRVWELATGNVVAPALTPPDTPTELAFTPGDPPGLLVPVNGRLCHFANALDGGENVAPKVHNRSPDRKSPLASRVALSPDLKWFATNGRPRAVVRDAKTMKPQYLREHPRGPQHGPIAFGPNGDVAAVAHGTKVDLWRFADPGAKVVELAGHKLPVWAVAYLPDGTVQTASSDGTVRVWDPVTGAERKRYDFGIGKLYCAAFSPDGLTCAAGGENGQVVVWDIE